MEQKRENPLGTRPVKDLLRSFAIPSIIAMMVSSLYNLVDQFFIGQSVGTLGNAATNIVFPLNTTCTALSLLMGIGGAAAFNLAMGAKKEEEAQRLLGNTISMLILVGMTLFLVTEAFLTPMLRFFGAPEDVLEYARIYTCITAAGFPFLIFTIGGGHLIRADGSPRYMMFCNLTGAIVNTVLDALFVFGFQMGMAGAALATVLGQVLSAFLVFRYLRHFKTMTIKRSWLVLHRASVWRIVSLGAAPFFNQMAMMVVQIIMNKSLKYYGGLSVYGEAIPLACSGIIAKVGMVFFSVVIGISQSLQPIVSFNYGAKKYTRVLEAYRLALICSGIISVVAFLCFQIFPRQIIGLFGSGSEAYFAFSVKYFRIYLMFTLVNFVQPISSNFFTAIGKPQKGIFLSLTRQIIFLLPLILIFPLVFGGIDGIIYAGPTADFAAFLCTLVFARGEWRSIKTLEAGRLQSV